jgi:cation diffusion facilitator family transporter
VILGALLIAVAGGIIWDAAYRFFNDQTISHGWLVLSVAGLSIASKETMFHLTLSAAKQTNSSLLKANAWHHRSDAVSSIVVLVGVGLEMAGYPYFDSIAALVVGLMVVKIGFDLVLDAGKELVDTALDAETVEQIRQVILAVEGVKTLHFLRTRKMGEAALVDVHIQVSSMISVSEGHLISEMVRLTLMKEVSNIGEVMVHIDPEDDEEESPSADLPMRKEVVASLQGVWAGLQGQENIKRTKLHYLRGGVLVEIELPLDTCETTTEAQKLVIAYVKRGKQLNYVTSISVQFS